MAAERIRLVDGLQQVLIAVVVLAESIATPALAVIQEQGRIVKLVV